MKFGVIVFPGINCDRDTYHVIDAVFGQPVDYIWHQDTDLSSYDCILLPGGFSYGDYLRAGAIARFSPVMRSVERFARSDRLVLGICNGFQILLEAGLLPGAMLRNDHLQFRCSVVDVRVESTDSPFTSACQKGQVLKLPIAHQEGSYFAPEDLLARLESRSQILLRYCDGDGRVTPEANPNGSLRHVAGLCNEGRNVFGLMPHPERCCEAVLGGTDGVNIFRSILGPQAQGTGHKAQADGETRGRADTGSLFIPTVSSGVSDGQPAASTTQHPAPSTQPSEPRTQNPEPSVPLSTLLDEVALTEEEYESVVAKLGRVPNRVELGMFGAMWSEHCGYKNSKPLLKRFPTRGPRVLQGPGENAGAVDIGDGLAVVMKIESHNHPSAVEPYQGAATGVGGIVRDIFTMGARPIALLDSLRFGPPSEPRNRYLASGIVGGIGGYGNCLGVPTVGGEIYFEDSYSGNPLVNAMCVGLARTDRIMGATASGAGNPVILVGADTGRDGIHGATFASVELNERSEERRPAVQVGNPFLEKLLIEACLELLETDYVVGMQDLGAAGLTSSSVEMAGRGGCGIDIDLLKVSRREEGMVPYELMLSESQERMLVVARRGCEGKVQELFARWGLHSDLIGLVTEDGLVRVREGERVVAEIPARLLTDEAPVYHRPGRRPAWLAEAHAFDLSSLPLKEDYSRTLLDLLATPNLCSRRAVFQQYDHMVQVNTVVLPEEGDAAVLRVKGTDKGIALTTDGNGRYCYLEPRRGGAIAVAEAARNLVCTGAAPLALTDCLNFGNPEKPEVFYTLRESVAGMVAACESLDIPVISGNVSLYNENNGSAVYPTPVVGMVGLLPRVERATGLAFRRTGDVVALLGQSFDDLGGTEYLKLATGKVQGMPPAIDLETEARVQRLCLEAINRGLVGSAHDCGDGGLAITLAESCMAGGVGLVCDQEVLDRLMQRDGCRPDSLLFGESQSRIVVSVAPEQRSDLERLAAEAGVSLAVLGTVGGREDEAGGRGDTETGRGAEERFRLGNWIDLSVSEMHEVWAGALGKLMDHES